MAITLSFKSKLENTFKNKYNKNDVKFYINKSDIKNKLYLFDVSIGKKQIEVFWRLGKFYLSEYDKNLSKYIEKINSNQELIAVCRELDKLVDVNSTKKVLGKYFNY